MEINSISNCREPQLFPYCLKHHEALDTLPIRDYVSHTLLHFDAQREYYQEMCVEYGGEDGVAWGDGSFKRMLFDANFAKLNQHSLQKLYDKNDEEFSKFDESGNYVGEFTATKQSHPIYWERIEKLIAFYKAVIEKYY